MSIERNRLIIAKTILKEKESLPVLRFPIQPQESKVWKWQKDRYIDSETEYGTRNRPQTNIQNHF